jgi:hypothetical protein
MLQTIGILANLAALVFCILIAIPMFKKGMIWQGIVSILCGLFALIYGSMKKDELGVGNYVIGLAVCIVVGIACAVLG